MRYPLAVGLGLLSCLWLAACAEQPEADQPFTQSSLEGALAQAPADLEGRAAPGLELSGWDEAVAVVRPAADLLSEVRALALSERLEEARERLEAHLRSAPGDEVASVLLAAVELLDERYDSAYSVAQDWLEGDPANVRMLEKRALASLLGHDIETALWDYQVLVGALARLRDTPRAVVCEPMTQCCTPAAAKLAEARTGLATVLYNRGELDQAEQLARETLAQTEADPATDSTGPQFVLALLASKRGNDEGALALYQDILSRWPTCAAALNNTGGVHYRRGDLDTALRYFTSAYEHAGLDRRGAAIAWSNVGEVSMLRGEYADAEDKLLEAMQISQGFAGAHFNLATLYDLQGKDEEARAHLATGLSLDEQGVTRWNSAFFSPEWKAHFDAMVSEHQGELEQAATHWRAVLAGDVAALEATAQRHLDALAASPGRAVTAR